MTYENLLYEVEDNIALITLNRPDKLNSLNQSLWKELRCALKEADQDTGVGAIILTGKGRGFCAGDDISILTDLQHPEIAEDLFINCIYSLVDTIIHLKKPLISAVNGYAYGGGCEIVLLSDLAVASEKAKFALPEGRIGAWPAIAAIFGPYLIGLKNYNELSLLGEPFDAQRAREVGLVNKVVPEDMLLEEARKMAKLILKSSPLSIQIVKEAHNKILGENLYDFWIACKRFSKETAKTHDLKEGSKAFVEKRQPRFKGE